MSREILIPRPEWQLRPYQRKLWGASAVEGKNVCAAWHRRGGKDEVLLNALAVQAMKRPASYMYMFPENSHARRSMWDAVNPHTGKRRILETFRPEMLARSPNSTEMKLELVNGSNITFFGSDNYDRAVGAGLAGIVSSEHALAHPNAYAFFSPMLRENGGFFWAISTPRGRNHFKQLVEYAAKSPRWFSEVLSIDDTGALSPEVIQEALEEYIGLYGEDEGRAYFNQEYRVDFNAAVMGAFFAREMADVRSEERIIHDLEPIDAPVHRAWDLGMRDDTTIWFWQAVGSQIYILDVYSTSGVGIEHYASKIDEIYAERKWKHGTDFVPHDAKVKELGTGRTRVETMRSFDLNPHLAPNAGLMDGINAARQTLKRCVFHERCETGIQALELYRREYNEELKVFRASPLHDWCFTGDTRIATRHGMCQIKDLPKQGEVLTQWGWKQYGNPRVTRCNAQLVEVAFTSGYTVRCTPDHTFLTEKGWISAESLERGSSILSGLTQSHSISMAAYTVFGRAKFTSRAGAKNCTAMSGLTPSGKFLMGATFTIETAIHQITRLKTSNACLPKSIYLKHGLEAGLLDVSSGYPRKQGMRLLSGTAPKKAGCGTKGTLNARVDGRSGSGKLAHASTAERILSASLGQTGISKNTATQTAKPLTIASVRRLVEVEDVWCLSVPGVEQFSLENGAIVHNCSHYADSFRYMALSWREMRPVVVKHEIHRPAAEVAALRYPSKRGNKNGQLRV